MPMRRLLGLTVNNLMVNVLTITAHGPKIMFIRVTVIGRV